MSHVVIYLSKCGIGIGSFIVKLSEASMAEKLIWDTLRLRSAIALILWLSLPNEINKASLNHKSNMNILKTMLEDFENRKNYYLDLMCKINTE